VAGALTIRAPLTGTVVALTDVGDEVFATDMVGPGLGIDPDQDSSVAHAPVAGVLAASLPHAFVVQSDTRGVLVHLGIDTVELGGAGFSSSLRAGDPVAVGDPVVRWDPTSVVGSGRSAVCPVVAVQAPPGSIRWLVTAGARVSAGDPLGEWSDTPATDGSGP